VRSLVVTQGPFLPELSVAFVRSQVYLSRFCELLLASVSGWLVPPGARASFHDRACCCLCMPVGLPCSLKSALVLFRFLPVCELAFMRLLFMHSHFAHLPIAQQVLTPTEAVSVQWGAWQDPIKMKICKNVQGYLMYKGT
jgi:hypothetical protein